MASKLHKKKGFNEEQKKTEYSPNYSIDNRSCIEGENGRKELESLLSDMIKLHIVDEVKQEQSVIDSLSLPSDFTNVSKDETNNDKRRKVKAKRNESQPLKKEQLLTDEEIEERYPHYENRQSPFKPIPEECIPDIPMVLPWYSKGLDKDIFYQTFNSLNLPPLPEEGEKALKPERVPKKWVEVVNEVILFIAKNSSSENAAKPESEKPVIPQWFQKVFNRFFITVINDDMYYEDGRVEKKRLVNWKTVYYVTHLCRQFASFDCYDIPPPGADVFSHIDMVHYNLDHWEIREEHCYRLAVVAVLTGDSLNGVATLDLILRFKRSMNNFEYCNTLISKGAPQFYYKSFAVVEYLADDGENRRYSWVEYGLSKETVSQMVPNVELYFDSPYCTTCYDHHNKDLKLCSSCGYVFYCSKECKKKDYDNHKKLCDRQRIKNDVLNKW